MRSWLRRYGLVSCLLCLGFWPLAQSAYIPAKAWLAQDLMQRAWQRARHGNELAKPWPWADTFPVARLTAEAGRVDRATLETPSSVGTGIRTFSSCVTSTSATR